MAKVERREQSRGAGQWSEGRPGGATDSGDDARGALLEGLPVTERRAELAGIPTAWLQGGEGPPLVLLHGPGEYGAKWGRVIPELVKRYRVVAPDLPGHGASGVPEGDLDEGQVLDWLGKLVAETCPSPPVLVGHVLGGAIAARYAARQVDGIRHLVLVDTLGLAPFRPAPRFALAMIHYMVRPREGTYERFMRQCSWDLDTLKEELGDRWPAVVAYQLERTRSPEQKKALRALMKQVGVPVIPSEELDRIPVPVTLIWGREDRANRLRVAEEASERFGWPLHVVDECADDPPRDRPGEFLAALRSALGQKEGPWS